MNQAIYRQGDVALCRVSKLPDGCIEIPPTSENKIVLALGEATGHHHRIEQVSVPVAAAAEIADAAFARARLWTTLNSRRYLEVLSPVSLDHEEHASIKLPPGVYALPVQVEHSTEQIRRVAD